MKHCDPETNPGLASEAAAAVAEIWNGLAKEHGWPPQANQESLLRQRKTLTGVMRGLDKLSRIPHGRSVETLLFWILSRWNWNKSPAPIAIAASSGQWNALAASLNREIEEAETTNRERLRTITAWVEKEFSIRRRNGLDGQAAKREIREFALATGKINAWSPHEQEHFLKELHGQGPANP